MKDILLKSGRPVNPPVSTASAYLNSAVQAEISML